MWQKTSRTLMYHGCSQKTNKFQCRISGGKCFTEILLEKLWFIINNFDRQYKKIPNFGMLYGHNFIVKKDLSVKVLRRESLFLCHLQKGLKP